MRELPAALFVVDTRHEHTAVREARRLKIPVVGLCGSDCDIRECAYPIVANDAARASVEFFIREIAGAYREGKRGGGSVPGTGAAEAA
jgi:small subunit ribosomal protein S2